MQFVICGIPETVWHRWLRIKHQYNSKNLLFLLNDFWDQIMLICADQSFSIPLNQNLLILLVSNICNGNIGTFWHRKLCLKTWYTSKSLWILPIFLVWFFRPKPRWYPQHTCYLEDSTKERIKQLREDRELYGFNKMLRNDGKTIVNGFLWIKWCNMPYTESWKKSE